MYHSDSSLWHYKVCADIHRIHWKGTLNDYEVFEKQQFSLLSLAVFRTFRDKAKIITQ